ncbi:hypothetical protein HK100_009312 [Physocladia obscura]|uniref:Arylamine N-acetyltransferase n=1 Tax=Physocladia obscura TaxID=109957 RepID=A0AAD5T545_9FUNG|nr:hypothetical protein HK100_009312 [Physocladia obscura]
MQEKLFRYNPLDNYEAFSNAKLEAYLKRIGVTHDQVVERDLSALNCIIDAHSRKIPFENGLLFFTDEKVATGSDAAFEHIIGRNRGGYCFQVNTLLISALLALKFDATAGVARSYVWDEVLQSWVNKGTTHMVVFVALSAEDPLYLVDVGFNQRGLTAAIPIKDGATISCAASEAHQIRTSTLTGKGNWSLWHKRADWAPRADGVDPQGDGFGPMFYFTLERYRPEDFRVLNYFVSHAIGNGNLMTSTFIVSIVTETGGRSVIVDKTFKRREDENHRELERVVKMNSVENLVDIMAEEFGIEMTEKEIANAKLKFF